MLARTSQYDAGNSLNLKGAAAAVLYIESAEGKYRASGSAKRPPSKSPSSKMWETICSPAGLFEKQVLCVQLPFLQKMIFFNIKPHKSAAGFPKFPILIQ